MPGLEPKLRNRVFLLRAGISLIGFGAGQLFISLCFHGILKRDQDYALDNSLLIMLVIIAVGEVVARLTLRKLLVMPKNKRIPLTY